ncbi:unnamed protein product [Cyprideis torosa]|uniref:Uncharacterized protein n=1 Tax=Cyprideis torosa TaxID=163714 RepID=A0A7R8ZPJ7_9CRUS|nr:unnamed protein product [Cyprideis torosa]CAG0888508.1 unnamed protein product [Cyprideis torosa]
MNRTPLLLNRASRLLNRTPLLLNRSSPPVESFLPPVEFFGFDCTNTLNDQLLENVRVEVEPSEGFNIFGEQPCERLEYNIPGTVYTLVSLPDDLTECTGTFSAVLKFNVRDCDPNTGQPETDDGYEDEYILEDFGLTVADQVSRVSKSNFGVAWDELGETNELQDTFALTTVKTLEEAVKNITDFLGMQPCERSDKVPEGKNSHSLFLAGVFRTGDDALVRARLAVSPHSEGVTMQLCVRSPNPNVAEAIAQSVG